jgi:K+ potassium transporter
VRRLRSGSSRHEPGPERPPDGSEPTATGRPERKRHFNEAGHKLYWPMVSAPRAERAPSAALQAAADDDRDVVAHASRPVLALGALGIVFGDLGTSPLYTMKTVFNQPTPLTPRWPASTASPRSSSGR